MRRGYHTFCLAFLCGTSLGCQAGPPCHRNPPRYTQPAYSPAPSCASSLGTAYAPSYQSAWRRAQVTAYGSVLQQNAISGSTVTTLQPCNTWEWQARRTRNLSLQHRPVYWSRYNSPDQQRNPTSCRSTGSVCTGNATAPAIQSGTPYYPQGNTRDLPSAPTVPRSTPADNRPQLDPIKWPAIGRSSVNSQASSRGVVSMSLPASHNERPAAVARDEVWDDTGWESEREW